MFTVSHSNHAREPKTSVVVKSWKKLQTAPWHVSCCSCGVLPHFVARALEARVVLLASLTGLASAAAAGLPGAFAFAVEAFRFLPLWLRQ
jgi:hypothetical protein